jgi:hypothetical protein
MRYIRNIFAALFLPLAWLGIGMMFCLMWLTRPRPAKWHKWGPPSAHPTGAQKALISHRPG